MADLDKEIFDCTCVLVIVNSREIEDILIENHLSIA